MVDDLNTFFDSREVPNGQSLVIGAAAAGITIAKEFSDTNLNLCLLESGGFVYEQEIENLNKCKVIGHDLPSSGSRLRFFGGSTNHRGGHCVPIRQIAFEKREWIPYLLEYYITKAN